MGIRKHFEQQKDTEELRLSEISLDTQESEKPGFDPETEISDTDWEGMKAKLKEFRKQSWWNFANLAMRMSILRPDQKSELQIDDQAWQGMKAALEESHKQNWQSFADLAMFMSILSAEKVQITDQGIELEMRKPDFKQEKSKRPERRNF